MFTKFLQAEHASRMKDIMMNQHHAVTAGLSGAGMGPGRILRRAMPYLIA
jgi:hypothetical protein